MLPNCIIIIPSGPSPVPQGDQLRPIKRDKAEADEFTILETEELESIL